jgi:hypothetical protein
MITSEAETIVELWSWNELQHYIKRAPHLQNLFNKWECVEHNIWHVTLNNACTQFSHAHEENYELIRIQIIRLNCFIQFALHDNIKICEFKSVGGVTKGVTRITSQFSWTQFLISCICYYLFFLNIYENSSFGTVLDVCRDIWLQEMTAPTAWTTVWAPPLSTDGPCRCWNSARRDTIWASSSRYTLAERT